MAVFRTGFETELIVGKKHGLSHSIRICMWFVDTVLCLHS